MRRSQGPPSVGDGCELSASVPTFRVMCFAGATCRRSSLSPLRARSRPPAPRHAPAFFYSVTRGVRRRRGLQRHDTYVGRPGASIHLPSASRKGDLHRTAGICDVGLWHFGGYGGRALRGRRAFIGDVRIAGGHPLRADGRPAGYRVPQRRGRSLRTAGAWLEPATGPTLLVRAPVRDLLCGRLGMRCSGHRRCQRWDAKAGPCKLLLEPLTGHTDQVGCLLALRGGSLASGSRDSSVRVWRGSRCAETLMGHQSEVVCLAELTSGVLASGAMDSTVRLWQGGSCLRVLWGHRGPVRAVAALPGGVVASAGPCDAPRLWW